MPTRPIRTRALLVAGAGVLLLSAIVFGEDTYRLLVYTRHVERFNQTEFFVKRASWLPGPEQIYPDQLCSHCYFAERPTEWIEALRSNSALREWARCTSEQVESGTAPAASHDSCARKNYDRERPAMDNLFFGDNLV